MTDRCTHRLGDRTGLVCIRTDQHVTHVYYASDAPDLPRDEEVDKLDPRWSWWSRGSHPLRSES